MCTSHHPCIVHSIKLLISWLTCVVGINAPHSTFVLRMRSIILFFDKPVSLHFDSMHVMSCNDGYESSHQPINLVTLEPPYIQGESLF